ncbi:MAG: hypothetical protein QOD86_16, partial [Miltoncostaeaceae bacterium]|nr:hypothetical protein [Miltoncostaeaceae bacterium]
MAQTTTVEVVMPVMGDSVSEGTVLEWHKKEGETISQDETIVEISTDKVDAEVPSPATGTIVKIHAAEGDTVSVGAVLAEIELSTDGDAPREASDGNGAGPANSAVADAPAPPADEPAAAEKTIDITMPAMGESVREGVILEWHKQPGETIAADETLVEISTDKVDAEMPSPATGTITQILAGVGDTVTVGQVIARMQGGAVKATPAPEAGAPARPAGDVETPAAPAAPDGAKASPVARRAAAAHGVDLGRVQGSGPAGRISKADVLAAANGEVEAAPRGELMKGAAAMLARYMDESREIPTATSFRTLAVTTLDGRRRQLKDAGQKV